MENASKALIIAGAILLAIVIISLGLIVVNNVRSTTDNTNLSEQEIQSFNAKFIAYEGEKVSASRVNTLIQQVVATNQATLDDGKNNVIVIGFPSIKVNKNNCNYLIVSLKSDGLYEHGVTFEDATIEGIVKGIKSKLSDKTTDAANSSLTVSSGNTYTVKLGYVNGLVQYIIVKANNT